MRCSLPCKAFSTRYLFILSSAIVSASEISVNTAETLDANTRRAGIPRRGTRTCCATSPRAPALQLGKELDAAATLATSAKIRSKERATILDFSCPAAGSRLQVQGCGISESTAAVQPSTLPPHILQQLARQRHWSCLARAGCDWGRPAVTHSA